MDGTPVPSFSEKGFIEALQMVVKFTGRYPEAIDTEGMRKVSMDVAGAMMTSDSPVAQQWREQIKNAGSKEAAMAIQPLMMKLMPLAMFQKMLGVQQKDPFVRRRQTDRKVGRNVGLADPAFAAGDGQHGGGRTTGAGCRAKV